MAEILNLTATKLVQAPKIVKVKPFGSTILVELLSNQELVSGSVILPGKDGEKGKGNANQGYIVALGPCLPADVGLKVGDRILINGGFVPAPETDGTPQGRTRGFVEVNSIKSVLVEEGKVCCGGGTCGDFPAADPNAPLLA